MLRGILFQSAGATEKVHFQSPYIDDIVESLQTLQDWGAPQLIMALWHVLYAFSFDRKYKEDNT